MLICIESALCQNIAVNMSKRKLSVQSNELKIIATTATYFEKGLHLMFVERTLAATGLSTHALFNILQEPRHDNITKRKLNVSVGF